MAELSKITMRYNDMIYQLKKSILIKKNKLDLAELELKKLEEEKAILLTLF